MKGKILLLACLVILILFSGCNSEDRDLINKDDDVEINGEKLLEDESQNTSMIRNEEELIVALKESYSITIKNDVNCKNDIIMEGDFSKTDTTEINKVIDVGRELNIFYIDQSTNVINNYVLEAPNLVIKSKDTTIKGGKFIGNIYVESNGFVLDDTKIDGNIYFRNLESKESFVIKNTSSISGEIAIKGR